MLGERNLKEIVAKAVDNIYKEQETKIDDPAKITVDEIVTCLRKAYYDRHSPLPPAKKQKLSSILREAINDSKTREYNAGDITLIGRVDAIVDNTAILFVPVNEISEKLEPQDLLRLNANLWIFDIEDGVIVYLDSDGNTIEYSIVRDKRVFDETIRRAKVLNMLLKESKTPIIEPSNLCIKCQYYERCYMQKKQYGDSMIEKLLGIKRDE